MLVVQVVSGDFSFSDSIEEGPTVKAAARCLVRSRLVATEPQ
jgi:hypothetical protein